MPFDEYEDQDYMACLAISCHLQQHKNQDPDPTCDFCKAFLIPRESQEGDYQFVVFDVSSENNK